MSAYNSRRPELDRPDHRVPSLTSLVRFGTLLVLPLALRGQIVEDFSGVVVSSATWHIPTFTGAGDGTYVGQTQFRCVPAALPAIVNGAAIIAVESYNPTGFSFYGTDLISNQVFNPGVNIIVRAKMNAPLHAGVVGGIFLYDLKPGSNILHDEIDFEMLGNQPSQIQTNIYSGEALGSGRPVSSNYASSLATDYHTYEIRWQPASVSWLVDGILIRTETTRVPTGPMHLHLNIWVPDAGWSAAYSNTLQATGTSAANQVFSMSVDSVAVTAAAPIITQQPSGATVAVGANVTFTVAASGAAPLIYQWRKDSVVIAGATSATLVRTNVGANDAGTYTVSISNGAGSITSNGAAILSVVPAIAITGQPQSVVVRAGGMVALTVAATGTPLPSYQWRKNGLSISGATNATLVLNTVSSQDAASYSVVITNALSSTSSDAAVLTITASSDIGRLSNLSILSEVTATAPYFTVGTVLGGSGTSGSKPLLVRAAGPSLTALGVVGALPDPKLDLFSGQAVIASNDNWGGTAALNTAFTQVGAFGYTSAVSKDAAIFNSATAAGSYTVQVSGVSGATGAVIAEIYDAAASSFSATAPRLINLSVLKDVPAGSILTAGFVIGGSAAKTVLIRAIGPRLAFAPFNISGVMANPKIDLFSGQTAIGTNDNWDGDAQLTTAGNAVGAFAVSDRASKDAMLLITLPPAAYSVQVRDAGGAGGLVIVEVYEVP